MYRPSLRVPAGRQRSSHSEGGVGQGGPRHAALVFDEDDLAQGWCQYGSREELGLKHPRENVKNPPPRARCRIACIFVDKGHRGRGVARAGLEAAVGQIAAAGGGLVEATPRRPPDGRLKGGSCSARPPSGPSSMGLREDGRSATRVDRSREIDPRSGHGQAVGEDTAENLVTVCRGHHEVIERRQR